MTSRPDLQDVAAPGLNAGSRRGHHHVVPGMSWSAVRHPGRSFPNRPPRAVRDVGSLCPASAPLEGIPARAAARPLRAARAGATVRPAVRCLAGRTTLRLTVVLLTLAWFLVLSVWTPGR